MLIRFLIYGALGVLVEVIWTGLASLRGKNFRLSSHTSLWMFFIYGCFVVMEPFFVSLAPWNFFLRGLAYAAFIYAGEFAFGSALKFAGVCPWDYTNTPYHSFGIIRADYLPCWIALGLLFERTYFALAVNGI